MNGLRRLYHSSIKSTQMQSNAKALTYSNRVLKSPSEVVYLEYKPDELPPKPSDEWTRFVCISDTHSRVFEVPSGDVLLHSGDLTNTGTVKEFQTTMEWLYSLPHATKIIIAGNHDLTLHTEWYEREDVPQHRVVGRQKLKLVTHAVQGIRAKKMGIVYLQDQDYKFQTKKDGRFWSVWGSPWSPEFYHWAFGYPRAEGEALVSKIPKTDILLTHGPPSQILDQTQRGDEAGCEALRARLPELRPRLHLFGHIHEAHGAYIHRWDPTLDNAPPTVQNTDHENDMDVDGRPAAAEAEPSDTDLERTVFVNAANWPMGRLANRDGVRPPFGGPGFQAVVVDLKD